ncbi:3-isopropylmalate dehydratase small subunit [Neomoorella mulderi]|uniref:3-isopropylmalate dehydratase small subunit n=1 Tax=Moorella mulderi DSM 14980 TaxID=1122241 RepID=A0A151AVU2_9FIRM|nr:3-isopropylmalate dehydratase small subunit [Moorella mulderi]KYH31758.1 2,3-dimethylmalate dehydratase small subunit [Moorella mulderi DSM 14980]
MPHGLLRGKAWKFGDNINTDLISPAQYMEMNYEEIGRHAMEGVMPGFSDRICKGDFIVAGENFGSGSSRETAQIALKYAGVGGVIAKSFARIFFRNSINTGLPVLELEEINKIEQGDELEVDLGAGIIKNLSKNESYVVPPLPANVKELVEAGGLIPYLRAKHKK